VYLNADPTSFLSFFKIKGPVENAPTFMSKFTCLKFTNVYFDFQCKDGFFSTIKKISKKIPKNLLYRELDVHFFLKYLIL
jgi:hypothetical protein